MIVDFELDPDHTVGNLKHQILNDDTMLFTDEVGNIAFVEVMSGVRKHYGDDPVTVEGLPALLRASPFPEDMSIEEYRSRRQEIKEWTERSWRGGEYRKGEK